MAEKKASFLITLTDGVSAGLNSIEKGIQSFKSSWVEVTAVVAAVTAEVYKSVTAFAEQEAATMRLNQALKNTSKDSRAATERLSELGEALSRTTGFSDNTITSMQAMLASMGFNEAAIVQLTPRVLDMSRAMGVDASSAAMALGKSIELGTSAPLKRMGIILGETAFKNRDFGAIMEEVDGKVRGAAEAYGTTAAGAIDKFKVAIEKLQEKIGEVLAEALLPMAKAFTDSAENLQSFVGIIKIFMAEISLVGTFIVSTTKAFGSLAAVMALAFERDWKGAAAAARSGVSQWLTEIDQGVQTAAQKIDKAWTQLKEGLGGKGDKKKVPGKTNEKPNTASVANLFSDDELKIKLAQLKGYHQLAERLSLEHELKLRNIAKDSGQAQALQTAQINKQKLDSTVQALDAIATFSKSKNKELALAGQVAAMGSAIIHTADAVTVALESAPPPFNFALAAAVGAAGAAQVATIAGVSFAEGGMAMPTSGGTFGRFAEAGKPEAVIPLDDPRTKRKLADTLGGGTHVHFHNSTIIADQMGFEKLAIKIDEALFRLRRNGQAVSF